MRNLVFIIHSIEDEILGAEHYAKQAARWKSDENDHWKDLINMAKQELDHANKLTEMASECCKETDACKELWTIEAERLMEWSVRIKMFVEGL